VARKRQKQTPKIIASLERRQHALELRKQGLTYREIGAKLGVTTKAAHKTVTKALGFLNDRIGDEARLVRRLELERLDVMQRGLWRKAKKGDPHAVGSVLRIQERRAKLLGLDEPEKHELTGKGGGPLNITDARARIASRIDRLVAGAEAPSVPPGPIAQRG